MPTASPPRSAAGSASGAPSSLAAAGGAALGALIEILLLRRIYQAPELFQLLATFALVLVINDVTLWIWGTEDLLGPRAPGLRGSVEILDRRFPSYDLFLIVVGPVVLLLLHLMLAKTRFGRLIRAATQDREMVGALGVNQALLFTARVRLRLGAGRPRRRAAAGARAGQPRDGPDRLGDAFVVVVVGGMGSITGAYLAAVIIAEIKALCIGIGVVAFRRLHGQFLQADAGGRVPGDGGRADRAALWLARPPADRGAQTGRRRGSAPRAATCRSSSPASRSLVAADCCCRSLDARSPYALVLGIDVLIAVLFATSLHFIMGPGGMHSFGHAAYFGLGAYGAGAAGEVPRALHAGARCSSRRSRPAPARCCSAGSRCGSPASISRC